MLWPSWLWFGTPLKFWLWLVNRLATWTGVFYAWRRFRTQRGFWVWATLANLISWGGLALLFFWLHHRASPGP